MTVAEAAESLRGGGRTIVGTDIERGTQRPIPEGRILGWMLQSEVCALDGDGKGITIYYRTRKEKTDAGTDRSAIKGH